MPVEKLCELTVFAAVLIRRGPGIAHAVADNLAYFPFIQNVRPATEKKKVD